MMIAKACSATDMPSVAISRFRSGAFLRSIGRRITRSSRTPTTPVPIVATAKATTKGLPIVASNV